MAVANGIEIGILRPGLTCLPAEPPLPRLAQLIKGGSFVFIRTCENVTPPIHVSRLNEAMNLSGDSVLASGRAHSVADIAAIMIEMVRAPARAANNSEPKPLNRRSFECVARTDENTGTVAA